MAALDLDQVREALTSGHVDALVGQRECKWLDAKSEPYKLGDPREDAELLKDAVALANAHGGVLVIGLETTKQGGRDVITGLRPVETAKVNLEQFNGGRAVSLSPGCQTGSRSSPGPCA
jgi:hypothetical protein